MGTRQLDAVVKPNGTGHRSSVQIHWPAITPPAYRVAENPTEHQSQTLPHPKLRPEAHLQPHGSSDRDNENRHISDDIDCAGRDDAGRRVYTLATFNFRIPGLPPPNAGETQREHDRHKEYKIRPDQDTGRLESDILVGTTEKDTFDLPEGDVLHEEHLGDIESSHWLTSKII